MPELTVESRDENGVTLLYPQGYINAHTVRLFEGELQRIVQQRRFRIVVDCTGLTYIASAGLGAMMGAIEEIRTNGGDLRLAGLNDTVRNIFEILGFHHLYRIFPSAREAVLSFEAPGEAP